MKITGRKKSTSDYLSLVEPGKKKFILKNHLSYLKHVSNKFFFNFFLFQNWLDYQLNWNMSEYGGVRSIRVHPKLIWTPDLLMYNRYPIKYFMYNRYLLMYNRDLLVCLTGTHICTIATFSYAIGNRSYSIGTNSCTTGSQ